MNLQYRAPDRPIDCGILLQLSQQAGSRDPRRDELSVLEVPGAENSMRMMRQLCVLTACATLFLLTSGTASAQYGAPGGNSTGVSGEDYHVELAYALWFPDRDIVVSSESLGIIGTSIDAVRDLGFQRETFQDLRVVLRPSRKFKFRFAYTPIKYVGDTVLTRTIVFNGQRYTVGLPVTSELDWKIFRFGIEYDFIARSRGFLGFIFEGKYTDMDVTVTAPFINEFTHVK